MTIKNKKILLIISGGISAYKSLDIIRLLKKNNCEIKTILTESGKEFVTPLSLNVLTGNKTRYNIFDKDQESEMDHIALSRWADVILVMPTTANFLSKLRYGKADDLATTVILASNKDIFLVPAMNVRMWLNKVTQDNYKYLKEVGFRFIGPIKGEMACGEYGEGKMSSPRQVFAELKDYFRSYELYKKKGISALVTAGPTREYIDPIRYISNKSSGKQGYEIAKALIKSGVKTTLITGPINIEPIKNLKIVKTTSGKEMFLAVKKELPVDIAVCAAAVTDFYPAKFYSKKIKKNRKDEINFNLKKNPDILEFLSKNNEHKPGLIVGFSAETENIKKNSLNKLKTKRCDLIIANDVSRNDIGFDVDYNEVDLIYPTGKVERLKKAKKNLIASMIVKKILNKFLVNDRNLN